MLAANRHEAATLNVLIIRTSAMGDIVHCLPVLTALRRALPEARIGWVVERAFAPLLERHPDIDELIVVRLREWRKSLLSSTARRQISEVRRALKRFAPDVALDLMGNHKGGLIAFSSGAPRTLGAARPFRRERSSAVWINERVDAPGTHAVDRALAVAAAFEPSLAGAAVDFGGERILARVPDAAQSFLEQRTRPFVTIQAGAGWGNKTYPPAWWGEVARRIRDRVQMEVWVPIAPGEEHLARAVVDASAGAARSVDAAGFGFLAALLRASRLVLGGDTGPLHLAHALGTPVLCLIGPTDPERNGPYAPLRGDGPYAPLRGDGPYAPLRGDGPYVPDALRGDGAVDRVLWKRLPCSCCYKRFDEPKACLLEISPAEVAARALEVLQSPIPASVSDDISEDV